MPEIEDQNFDSLVRDMKENDFTFLLGGGASLSSNVMSPGFLALNWFRILRKFMNDQDMPPADSDYAWVPDVLKEESRWDDFRNLEKNPKKIAMVYKNRDNNNWFRLASFVIDGIPKCYFEIATMLEEIHPSGKAIIRDTTIKIADNAFPSIGYYLLAKLMATPRNVQTHKTIRHDAVITTNFDEMLHQGFIRLRNDDSSMRTSFTNPQCITISDDPVQLNVIDDFLKKRDRPLIYHVHNSQDFNPRNTIRDVSYYTPRMNEALRKLINGRGLLVMGYSGADEGLMTALVNLVNEGNCKRIYWLCYRGNIPDSRPFMRLRNALRNNLVLLNCPKLEDNTGCRPECKEGFDSFMWKLLSALSMNPSLPEQSPPKMDRPSGTAPNLIEPEPIDNADSSNMNPRPINTDTPSSENPDMKDAEIVIKIKPKKYQLLPFENK